MKVNHIIMEKRENIERPEFGADSMNIRYKLQVSELEQLINQAETEEEKAYLREISDRMLSIDWAFNMILVVKHKCGHYEVLQTYVRNEADVEEWLQIHSEHAAEHNCTRCFLNSF